MNRFFTRLIAVLVIFCLAVEPSLSSSCPYHTHLASRNAATIEILTTEALTPYLTSADSLGLKRDVISVRQEGGQWRSRLQAEAPFLLLLAIGYLASQFTHTTIGNSPVWCAVMLPPWLLKKIFTEVLERLSGKTDETEAELLTDLTRQLPLASRRELLRLAALATGKKLIERPLQVFIPDMLIRLTQEESRNWLFGPANKVFDGAIHFSIAIPPGHTKEEVLRNWGKLPINEKRKIVRSQVWPGRIASEILARAGNKPAAGLAALYRSRQRPSVPTLNLFRARHWEKEVSGQILPFLPGQIYEEPLQSIHRSPGLLPYTVDVYAPIMESQVDEILPQLREPSPELLRRIEEGARQDMRRYLNNEDSDRSKHFSAGDSPNPIRDSAHDTLSSAKSAAPVVDAAISQRFEALLQLLEEKKFKQFSEKEPVDSLDHRQLDLLNGMNIVILDRSKRSGQPLYANLPPGSVSNYFRYVRAHPGHTLEEIGIGIGQEAELSKPLRPHTLTTDEMELRLHLSPNLREPIITRVVGDEKRTIFEARFEVNPRLRLTHEELDAIQRVLSREYDFAIKHDKLTIIKLDAARMEVAHQFARIFHLSEKDQRDQYARHAAAREAREATSVSRAARETEGYALGLSQFGARETLTFLMSEMHKIGDLNQFIQREFGWEVWFLNPQDPDNVRWFCFYGPDGDRRTGYGLVTGERWTSRLALPSKVRSSDLDSFLIKAAELIRQATAESPWLQTANDARMPETASVNQIQAVEAATNEPIRPSQSVPPRKRRHPKPRVSSMTKAPPAWESLIQQAVLAVEESPNTDTMSDRLLILSQLAAWDRPNAIAEARMRAEKNALDGTILALALYRAGDAKEALRTMIGVTNQFKFSALAKTVLDWLATAPSGDSFTGSSLRAA